MRVQRRRPSELTPGAGTVVVIDVLRMTSTASVIMARRSCEGVAVVATPGDLARLPWPPAERVVISELPSASGVGARVDNSPAQVSSLDFGQRTPVIVTTNGTRTLLAAAACAERVLLASFRDLHAVARHLLAIGPASVVISPAGHFASGEARTEDDLCADALASILAGREPDLAACAARIRADPRVLRRVEAEPGFSADLDLALEADPRAAVLELRLLAPGVGRIVRT